MTGSGRRAIGARRTPAAFGRGSYPKNKKGGRTQCLIRTAADAAAVSISALCYFFAAAAATDAAADAATRKSTAAISSCICS